MATSKGVIQGYTGVAAVDARHQIIVEAQAHGAGSEQELLIPKEHPSNKADYGNSVCSCDSASQFAVMK